MEVDTMAKRRLMSLMVAVVVLVLGLPGTSGAVTQTVSMRDNTFNPKEVRIDPGDRVIWRNNGAATHSVTSEISKSKGGFDSGKMNPGQTFSQQFNEEGYYFYYCKFHGSPRAGMWGVVIVGNPPPPPELKKKKDNRPVLTVPTEFPTIQKAVDAAKPGSIVLINPGVYKEAVVVTTPRLTIKGVDRFRTVLHGQDKRSNGITVDGVGHVSIMNLTVRNYAGNGIYFNDAHHYLAARIDSIKNRTYGLYAFDSYNGVFRDSWGYGSADSPYYIGQCLNCGALIKNVVGKWSYMGYSGTNATGVVIRDSRFVHNGVGLAPNTLPTEDLAPNRSTLIVNNVIKNNNYETIPAAGISETFGFPYGTGVWMIGTSNNVVRDNVIENHNRYGVLLTPSIDPNSIPVNNRVLRNRISDSGVYDLAWDGVGKDNCFSRNRIEGETGPPEIQTLYACKNRPFVGVPWPFATADVVAQVPTSQTREQKEPPEPKRPRCQKGAPGCNR
jgi:plastocyanin